MHRIDGGYSEPLRHDALLLQNGSDGDAEAVRIAEAGNNAGFRCHDLYKTINGAVRSASAPFVALTVLYLARLRIACNNIILVWLLIRCLVMMRLREQLWSCRRLFL